MAGYSVVPHDTHDWDVAAAPMFTGQSGNSQGSGLYAGGKDGYVYSVNLNSNRILWQTAITTVDQVPAVPVPDTPISFCPGTTGGVEWNGPAYSPKMNAVFSNGVDICATQLTEEHTFTPYATAAPACGGLWLGSNPCYSFGTPSSNKYGWITSMDASSGAVRWQYRSSTPMIAGVTTTASGLLITGDLNGNVLFFDSGSGTILKSIPANTQQPEPLGGGVISYGVGSKQYVAVAAGINSSLLWTPGTSSPSEIVVFGL
jgi:alcohol dehydrogenase (cytochrome c)